MKDNCMRRENLHVITISLICNQKRTNVSTERYHSHMKYNFESRMLGHWRRAFHSWL